MFTLCNRSTCSPTVALGGSLLGILLVGCSSSGGSLPASSTAQPLPCEQIESHSYEWDENLKGSDTAEEAVNFHADRLGLPEGSDTLLREGTWIRTTANGAVAIFYVDDLETTGFRVSGMDVCAH